MVQCDICKKQEADFICANVVEIRVCGYCMVLCDIDGACVDEVSTLEISTNIHNYLYMNL